MGTTTAINGNCGQEELFQPFSINTITILGTVSHVVIWDSGMGTKAEFRVTTRERMVRGREVSIKEQTHHCVAWGAHAERVARYGCEGGVVHVRGEMRYRRHGEAAELVAAEVFVREIVFSSAE